MQVLVDPLGQAEVHDAGVSTFIHDDVRGLDVAMHDPLAPRVVQSLGGVLRDRERQARREPALFEELLDRLALDKVHDKIRLAFVAADRVDGNDVGMLQPRRGLRLALEALHVLFGGAFARQEDLDRHLPPQDRVARLVDNAHAPAADLRQDLVRAHLGRQLPGALAGGGFGGLRGGQGGGGRGRFHGLHINRDPASKATS